MQSPTPPASLDLVGSAEAERILGGINRTTLMRWVAEGRLPLAYKIPGKNGAALFHRADVVVLANHNAAAVAERAAEMARAAS